MKFWFGMHEAVTRDLVAEVDRYIVCSGQATSTINQWIAAQQQ